MARGDEYDDGDDDERDSDLPEWYDPLTVRDEMPDWWEDDMPEDWTDWYDEGYDEVWEFEIGIDYSPIGES